MSLENAFVLGAEGAAIGSDATCERLATVVMRLVQAGKRVVLFAGPTRERAEQLRRDASRLPGTADAWDRAAVLARGSFESAERISWWLSEHGVVSTVIEDTAELPVGRGCPNEAEPRRVSARRISKAFEEASVVIIPGGVAQDGTGRVMSLGSGGTALSAVFAGDRLALPVRVLGSESNWEGDEYDGAMPAGLPRRAALLARDSQVSVFAAEDASVLLPAAGGRTGRNPGFAVRANVRFATSA
ncbi:MAG: hypothetical protein AAGI53_11200 [Planctomycetota bacterium]